MDGNNKAPAPINIVLSRLIRLRPDSDKGLYKKSFFKNPK